MEVRLTKWGNSFGIRLPKTIINDLDIKENDILLIEIKNNQIILKKNNYGEISIKEYAESYYGKSFSKLQNVLSNEELDWGKPIGEETW